MTQYIYSHFLQLSKLETVDVFIHPVLIVLLGDGNSLIVLATRAPSVRHGDGAGRGCGGIVLLFAPIGGLRGGVDLLLDGARRDDAAVAADLGALCTRAPARRC